LVNVPISSSENARPFYEELFGREFALSLSNDVESHHMPISRDGIYMSLTNPQREGEPVVNYYAVTNLRAAITALEKKGGSLLAGPFDMPVAEEGVEILKKSGLAEVPTKTLGQAAIVKDPDGHALGLLQLHKSVHASYKVGEFRQDLTAEQEKRHARSLKHGKEFALRKVSKKVAKKTPHR
jgi:predicted enzyme related to lactoylglutathione lyase